jgi:hypothetical protein
MKNFKDTISQSTLEIQVAESIVRAWEESNELSLSEKVERLIEALKLEHQFINEF